MIPQAMDATLRACQTHELLPALAGALDSLKAGKARCALQAWFCRCAKDGSMPVPLPGSDLRQVAGAKSSALACL